jgi:hypothetical protein
MRLIPDYMFERLNQVTNVPDFGDPNSLMSQILTGNVAEILQDKTRSTEERVRIFTQHLLRKLQQREEQSLSQQPQQEEEQTPVQQPEAQPVPPPQPVIKKSKKRKRDDRQNVVKTFSSEEEEDEENYGTADEGERASGKAASPPPLRKIPEHSSVKPKPAPEVRQKKSSGWIDWIASGREKAAAPPPLPTPVLDTRDSSPEGLPSTRRLLNLPPQSPTPPSSALIPLPAAPVVSAAAAPSSSSSSKAQRVPASSAGLGKERNEIRSNLKKLLNEFFMLQSDGSMIFRDDSDTVLRGADHEKIINFLAPSKNVNPTKKPNGIAAVVDILRTRGLFSADRFPNTSLPTVFKEYGNKPSAYTERIRQFDALLETSKKIESVLSQDGSGISWPALG